VSSGLAFKTSVKILIRFSMIETKQHEGSYALHPVVQDWCLHIANTGNRMISTKLDELALICVGYSAPSTSERNWLEIQRRLIPHADHVRRGKWRDDNIAAWRACLGIGNLYWHQGKLSDAEEMYHQALAGHMKALGPDHTFTLDSVHCNGRLYHSQGKLKEGEEMYQRALAGREKVLGSDHTSTLYIVHDLGFLYRDQGKLKEADVPAGTGKL
jgi:tetratricopeptide (TPR) repeat protein